MTGRPTIEESIFLAAIERTTPEERIAYVDHVCGSNFELRSRVLELLDLHATQGPFDAVPSALMATRTVEPEPSGAGDQIGPYKLLERIGEGGFGVVYMADQQSPVRRRVALKIIKPGMDTREVLRRFEAERQALALMDHPHIARALDAGATDSGRPYFVMELVRGVAVTDYCDQNNLAVHERLDLFVQICHAVQHAHQKGIIHRDIKPSNVLVTMQDGRPVAKVIDFGVAKAINQQLTQETIFTRFAEMIGTPLYMSPEQAEMTSLDIDTRSDIYSLGVLLYELLTGTTPFDKNRLKQAAHAEICRIIREEEPPKPSTRISTLGEKSAAVAAHRHADPKRLGQLVRGDLDWIVMKALEKDRTRRYETATGLAMEIQRYLAHEAVLAGPPSAVYRFRKFARRNRAALAMAAVVTVALVLGIVGTTWQAIWAQQLLISERRARADEAEQREQAEVNFQQARAAVEEYFTTVSESKLLDVPGLQPLRKQLLEAALQYHQEFANQKSDDPAMLAELAASYLRIAEIYHAIDRNDDAIAAMQQAITLIDRLRHEFPSAHDQHARLAGFWKGFRRSKMATQMPSDPQEALRALERLASLWETFVRENPTRIAFQSDLAAIYIHLGDLSLSAAQPDAAITYLRKARVIGEKLVRENPDTPSYRGDLAQAYQYLATALRGVGETREADELGVLALAVIERAATDPVGAPQHRFDFARNLLFLASRLQGEGDTPQAEANYRRAIGVLNQLVEQNPREAMYFDRLLSAQITLARILQATGKPDEAEELMRQNVKLRAESLTNSSPQDPRIAANNFSTIVDELSKLLNSDGRQEEAQQVCKEAIDVLAKRIVSENPNPADADWQFATAFVCLEQAKLLDKAGDAHQAAESLRQSLALFEKTAADHPANQNSRGLRDALYQGVGNAHQAAGRMDEARNAYRQGAVGMAKLASEFPHVPWYREAVGHQQRLLAFSMSDTGDAQQKEHAFREAVDTFAQLTARHPKEPTYRDLLADTHYHLGVLLAANKRFDESVREHRRRCDILARAADNSPDDLGVQLGFANAHNDFANMLKEAGRIAESEQGYLQAVTLKEKLVARAPANPDYRLHLAHSHLDLGHLFRDDNRLSDAETSLREAVAIFSKLVTDFPKSDNHRVELGHALWHLGDAFANAGRTDDAAVELRRSVDVFSQASKDFPNNTYCGWEDGFANWKLGWLFRNAGRHADAEPHFREALAVYRGMWTDDPKNADYRGRFAQSHHELIETSLALTRHAEAAQLSDAFVRNFPDDWDGIFRAAGYLSRCAGLVAVDESIHEVERKNTAQRYDGRAQQLLAAASPHVANAWTINNYAWGLVAAPASDPGVAAFAITATKLALEKEPNNSYFWNTLGVAHYRAGQWQLAIEALERSNNLSDGQYVGADAYFLAMAHWQSGDQERARQWQTLAWQWTERYAGKNEELSRFRAESDALLGLPATQSLGEQGSSSDVVATLTAILEEAPDLAWAYRLRGQEYTGQSRWDEAAADFAKAVELRRDRISDWYALSLVHLARHSDEQYRETCSAMLEQFVQSGDANTAYFVAWSCAVAPAALADFAPACALAEKALAADPKSAPFAGCLGAILYRAGRFNEALEKLENADELFSSADASRTFPAYTSYFLAMTHHRLEDADKAKKWFDAAREETDKVFSLHEAGTAKLPWNRLLTLTLLRQEVEVLMGIEQQSPPESVSNQ